jgi:ribosomal protein S18 acetylase RimI-like enzyme
MIAGVFRQAIVTLGPVGVRRVRADEWEGLRALRIRALEDSPDSFGSTAVEALSRDETDWRAWAATGATSPMTAIFVAETAGRLVGLCGAFVHQDDSRIAQIVAMWVDPGQRGRRLGERLLDAASAWSTVRGAQQLMLDVTETNDAARRLYGRAGFRETGATTPLRSNPALTTLEMCMPLHHAEPVRRAGS